jgi:hypothetical protein
LLETSNKLKEKLKCNIFKEKDNLLNNINNKLLKLGNKNKEQLFKEDKENNVNHLLVKMNLEIMSQT